MAVLMAGLSVALLVGRKVVRKAAWMDGRQVGLMAGERAGKSDVRWVDDLVDWMEIHSVDDWAVVLVVS